MAFVSKIIFSSSIGKKVNGFSFSIFAVGAIFLTLRNEADIGLYSVLILEADLAAVGYSYFLWTIEARCSFIFSETGSIPLLARSALPRLGVVLIFRLTELLSLATSDI